MQKHAASSEIISTDKEAIITNAADSKFCDTFFFISNENNENKGLIFYVNHLLAKSPVGHVFFFGRIQFVLITFVESHLVTIKTTLF